MRVVIDTNVLIRAIISRRGPACALLENIVQQHVLVCSLPLLDEVYEVLRRPKLRKLHGLSEKQIRKVIANLFQIAELAELPSVLPKVVPDDRDDDAIILTAVFGNAHAICTLDKHIHADAVVEYCRNLEIRIVTDVNLLTELTD